MSKVIFPQYKKGKQGTPLVVGDTILDHIHRLGIEIASECGGHGQCGKCVVRIERGTECVSPWSPPEQAFGLQGHERLACQAVLTAADRDVYIFMREFGKYSILSETKHQAVDLNPFVRKRHGTVVHLDGGRLGPVEDRLYGAAVDCGTTTLVMEIFDLETGDQVASLARKNPQVAYGNDVISRTDYTMRHPGGLQELQASVMSGLNEMLAQVEEEHPGVSRSVYEAVVVGNCTMRDLFFGIDVRTLGVIPFEPLSTDPVTRTAAELGLDIHPNARVYGPPLIGGHAGADCLGVIIATELYKAGKPCLAVDIGTNGEVALGNRHKIMTCSCAAGGAYEGATVRSGTGAIEGAIKTVRIVNGVAEFETIGDKPAVGLCGSALIDLLAELLRSGLMTWNARLTKPFTVTDGLGLEQDDIFQLITAKAGLRLDQDLLMKYYGVTPADLDKMYLAGGFGNFIDVENATLIGLFPNIPEKAVKVGNAALEGAAQMLLSQEKRADAERVAREIEHVKPNEREPDFPYIVAGKMYFDSLR